MTTDTAQSTAYVGQPLRRREDFKFLTGNGRYVDDIKLPGMLHLAILRSPHAHARITGVDLSAARTAAGVRLALAGAELAGKIGSIKPNWILPGTQVPDRPLTAVDRVRFVGECVALAVAETREMAFDALECIDVGYEVLPVVVTRRSLSTIALSNCTTTFRTISRPISRLAAAITPQRCARPISCCAYALSTIGSFRPVSRPAPFWLSPASMAG
jgi:xanthine dehydrogenase molybdopterin-binding subunit B